jgi:septal ring factor EnvC (AmiA/AmiB activator)
MPRSGKIHFSGKQTNRRLSMSVMKKTAAAAFGLIAALGVSQARAESTNSADAEIAALKRQLQLMEQKLDSLQKQTSANTTATAPRSRSRGRSRRLTRS